MDITNGNISTQNDVIADTSTIPEGLNSPFILNADKTTYLADRYDGELVDGFWFIEIDGIVSVRELYRFPADACELRMARPLSNAKLMT
nr:Uncharacterised protein [Klebsiella pneumoniae]